MINCDQIEEDEDDHNLDETSNQTSHINRMEKILLYEFLNFCEVYIHSVLYLRNVYPPEAFFKYRIYSLNFLNFIIDDEISKQISMFLEKIEGLLFSKAIKNIYILIINCKENKLLEVFNLEIDFPDIIYKFDHEELCLYFKSALHKLYLQYSNRRDEYRKINKTFLLGIETKESKLISNHKIYQETISTFESSFISNLFTKSNLNIYNQREDCARIEDINIFISIYRNFL